MRRMSRRRTILGDIAGISAREENDRQMFCLSHMHTDQTTAVACRHAVNLVHDEAVLLLGRSLRLAKVLGDGSVVKQLRHHFLQAEHKKRQSEAEGSC